jgi:putative DNA primase/helicase
MPTLTPLVQIHSMIHDLDTNTFFNRWRFRNVRGKIATLNIPRALQHDPKRTMERLSAAGAVMPSDRKEATDLVDRALAAPPKRLERITGKTGWRGAKCFVSHHWTVPPTGPKFLSASVLIGTSSPPTGDVESWRNGLREACAASPYLSFALGVAFSAPLLDLIGQEEGAVFFFRGPSSTGKSLMLRVAQSVMGRGGRADLPTFDVTPTGLHELCAGRNDLLLCLDEYGRATEPNAKRQLKHLAYTVPSGRGKVRSAVTSTQGLADLSWRVMGLCSGEIDLATVCGKRDEGETVRLIEIAVPDRSKGGIFTRAQSINTADLAQGVEATISANYAVAMQAYVGALVEKRAEITIRAKKIMDEFLAKAPIDPLTRRFAEKFAVVAAAMSIAVREGVAPWSREAVGPAIFHVYRNSFRIVQSTESAATSFLHRLAKAAIGGAFPIVRKGTSLPTGGGVHGFRRDHGAGRRIVAIKPLWFGKQFGSRARADAVLKHLIEGGVALAAPDGKRHPQLKVHGANGRPRWVCIWEDRLP